MSLDPDKISPITLTQPYSHSRCWHGIRVRDLSLKKLHDKLCNGPASLYVVSRDRFPSSCRMYLCDKHRKMMEESGYTVKREY